MTIAIPHHLSDEQLEAALRQLARSGRDVTVQLIAHLAAMDAREVHLARGYRSLFEYCRGELLLSEASAFNRILAARAARRYPEILGLLTDGSVNLTTIRLLAPRFTDENRKDLLAAAMNRSRRAVEELIARLFPREDVLPAVRRLPTLRPTGAPAAGTTPLGDDRYGIQFTASKATYEKLRAARDLLGFGSATADLAGIFDRALTALLEDLARRKFGSTDRPRRGRGTGPDSREIPVAVKRVVWVRDLGRCAFVSVDGRRCTATRGLQFHHVKPWSVGGLPTAENISLRCGPHNRHEARTYFAASRAAAPAVSERPAPAWTGRSRSSPVSGQVDFGKPAPAAG
jgi:hypothetical protein